MELAQQVSRIQPVKSGEKSGVFVDFDHNGSEQSSQVVLFSEQGQSSVQCHALPSSAQWVYYDSVRETNLILQLVHKNKVSWHSTPRKNSPLSFLHIIAFYVSSGAQSYNIWLHHGKQSGRVHQCCTMAKLSWSSWIRKCYLWIKPRWSVVMSLSCEHPRQSNCIVSTFWLVLIYYLSFNSILNLY